MNLSKLYINRYLRCIPPVAVMVWLFTTSLPYYMTNEPVLYLEHSINKCKKWWWIPFLFVTNYSESSKQVCISLKVDKCKKQNKKLTNSCLFP